MLIGNYPRTASQPLAGCDNMDKIEHAAIIDALEKGDTAIAQKVMQEHVESVMGKLMGMIAE